MKTYLKHKNIFNGIICAALLTFMILAMPATIYAASASVSISSSNVTQGDEFNVTVTIKADSNIGAYNFYIDYDADVIEAVSGFNGGGNGRIQLMYYVPSTDVTNELTAKITFKAKNPGTTSIKYVSISDDNGVIDFDTTDNMNVTSQDGSVTVKAPYVASTNNYLSSLKVEAVKADGSTYSLDLSPSFSKDVTKYSAEAVEGVTKLVVSATQEDSKASITTSGTKMDPGDNTTTITVTAEDGSTRKYVIYTAVAKPPETTTAPPEPVTVQIDGTDSYIEDINDAVALPEGFETFEYQYKDKTVVAAKGLVKNLIVMYVTKGDGSAGQLYVYDEATDTFYPMSNIQITQKLYTIVKEPEDMVIPDGFTETTVSVGEQSFKGWVNSEVENIYLIYAMNWNGESGLYYYDVNEEQIMRYFDIAVQAGVAVDTYNSLLSANEKLKDEINQLKADNNSKEESGNEKLYKYLALGCSIMAVIYLGIIIYLVVGKKKDNEEDIEADADVLDETANAETEVEETADSEPGNVDTENADTEAVDTETTDDIETMDNEVSGTETIENEVSDNEAIENEAIDVEVSDTETSGMEDTGFCDINDEQDEIDDMLMDFEDIITGETEAAIAEETKEIEETEEIAEEKTEFAEEIQPDIEALAEEAEMTEEAETEEETEVTEAAETEENEVTEETETEEAVQTTSDEKKKKVEQIMDDKENSINADDLDMVIDELFDDLFG